MILSIPRTKFTETNVYSAHRAGGSGKRTVGFVNYSDAIGAGHAKRARCSAAGKYLVEHQ